MTRCFIAVEMNEKSVIDNILAFQKSIVNTGSDLKLVELANIHITLVFLGEISKAHVEMVQREMAEVKFKPFEVELKEVGAFPNLNRINVIWIGIQRGAMELNAIYSQLESRLRKTGFQLDNRGFSPHITIARVRSGRNREKLADIISEAKNMNFGIVQVKSIKLQKSILTPEGPLYSTLYETVTTN
ncbi:MAG: 2,3-cyclic 3-phosphodiesterase [Thermoproteota archaeon]|nr:2,3-cyclic 3-phosphodiesterase [Thermoproteota archaeon]